MEILNVTYRNTVTNKEHTMLMEPGYLELFSQRSNIEIVSSETVSSNESLQSEEEVN